MPSNVPTHTYANIFLTETHVATYVLVKPVYLKMLLHMNSFEDCFAQLPSFIYVRTLHDERFPSLMKLT